MRRNAQATGREEETARMETPLKGTTQTTFDAKAFERQFTSAREMAAVLTDEEPPPADLEGTFFKNFPALFEVGNEPCLHPFDADGMVAAVYFQNGTAPRFRSRYVKTVEFEQEQNRTQRLFNNVFGTLRAGPWWCRLFDTELKNVANTNVMFLNGKLFSLWEAGSAYELDPCSLDTFGWASFKRRLEFEAPMSAHPKYDRFTGRLVTFSAEQKSAFKTSLRMLEVADDEAIVAEETIEAGRLVFAHDFAVTENNYVFLVSPIKLDPLPFLLGQKAIGQCLSMDKSTPTEAWVIKRAPPTMDGPGGRGRGETRKADEAVLKIPLDNFFAFHIANAFEDGKGGIVMDIVRMDSFDVMEPAVGGSGEPRPVWEDVDWQKAPRSTLWRYTFSGNKSWKKEPLEAERNGDLPTINPQFSGSEHRYIYHVVQRDEGGNGPGQALQKTDTFSGQKQRWIPEPDEFIGEAVYAPRKDLRADEDKRRQMRLSSDAAEDDGYLLAYLFRGPEGKPLETELLLFEAADIPKGPIRRWRLPGHLPQGLHGQFYPGLTWPERRLQNPDKFSFIGQQLYYRDSDNDMGDLRSGSTYDPLSFMR
uniref:Dioxygenase n=1 Tax=Chromera velia CCMP2878 TaxID=1169474 RepID=A0A0G4GF27_9ALVE|eukprot:Cvel_4617.t1-p1 / transcript=Cvel_4617.t1 / gene=Cvel_4617 / organism=Chromera_velia_CCMP2878 / gene_product=Apocarotenoid-15,15'-oxygenase, putative / transcript_product=Apocarotenoid-15,15'-oxygenase, putative / location=Cvel_scaffold203:35953-44880(-) / protein_length=589 / sequence_SO=supercontig / SO=protein_coding / is_pseudo=false